MERAFQLLLAYAGNNHAGLGDVAHQLVDGRLTISAFIRHPPPAK